MCLDNADNIEWKRKLDGYIPNRARSLHRFQPTINTYNSLLSLTFADASQNSLDQFNACFCVRVFDVNITGPV